MKVLLAFLLAIAGAALLFVGLTSSARDPRALPLVATGLAMIVAALAGAVILASASWRRRRADAFESPDALARWWVPQADMDAFRRLDAMRSQRIWSLRNALAIPRQVGGQGWPVAIGQRSLIMGDTFVPDVTMNWRLGEASWHEGDPGFIELSSMLELAKGETIVVHRFPVPAAARAQAWAGFQHLRSLIVPSRRDRIHHRYATHFAAAMQASDAPHPIMQRRKTVIIGLAVFFALIVASLASVVMSR